MSPSFSKVVEHIIIRNVLDSDMPFVGRTAIERISLALCAVMVGVGLIFLLYALYLYLQTVQTPAMAAGVTGLGALILGGMIGSVQMFAVWFKLRKIRKMKADLETIVRDVIASANDDVGASVRENPKLAVMVAALAGYMLGDRFL